MFPAFTVIKHLKRTNLDGQNRNFTGILKRVLLKCLKIAIFK